MGRLTDIDSDAKKFAGNFLRGDGYVMWKQPRDPEKWCLYGIRNRNSDLLTQSNADAIEAELEPFMDVNDIDSDGLPMFNSDLHSVRSSCSMVGWVDEILCRVYDNDGRITPAFRAFYALLERMDDHPVLDEDDWSQRESENTWKNVRYVVERILNKHDSDLNPDEVAGKIELSDSELEPRDGWGGYPSDEAVEVAIAAAGYKLNKD